MDQRIAKVYIDRIKELKAQLRHNYSEATKSELDTLEDDYAWLKTGTGWAQYQTSLARQNKGVIQ